MIVEEDLEEVGKISHYFTKIGVAIIDLKATLKVGDEICVKGSTTDFSQKVSSMQIEHENVDEAEAGKSIGLKLDNKAREGDVVYKVLE